MVSEKVYVKLLQDTETEAWFKKVLEKLGLAGDVVYYDSFTSLDTYHMNTGQRPVTFFTRYLPTGDS